MFKEEHKQVLEILDQKAQLEIKVKEQEKIIEQNTTHYNELKQRMELQRDEFLKQATKQALGRRNIETKLMEKDEELSNLKNENDKLKQHIAIYVGLQQLQQQQLRQQQQLPYQQQHP
ncbi:uncharacterized protein BX663DRAFT_509488 [Cokeromyces recurvatus]|uniref:uncharacterized protein n=1 Tax=Cokeromyces recurvatus TaxID=90255 RepID=UPI00221FDDA8|nr:uncharacterized protein BX663DRAFT_509488 [Cokeromyces recurvatus]KAI7903080.1 hypothetical protein BX663DRAFT_509488 [Cokeromyces recurvatus]